MNEFSDEELLRYSRQILLPQIDLVGQQKLCDSKVLLLGAGGLGSPVAMYLTACGIGEITIVDPDTVDLSNLQRQILHNSNNIGDMKVHSAEQTLVKLNPAVSVNAIDKRLSSLALKDEVAKADVVVDATDNFESRFEINHACVATKTPLVVGAAIRFEGQVMVFTMQNNSACYQCLYPKQNSDESNVQESCAENGILGPVTGQIGCVQAIEVIKLLVNCGELLTNKLLIVDTLNNEWHKVKINKDPKCKICS